MQQRSALEREWASRRARRCEGLWPAILHFRSGSVYSFTCLTKYACFTLCLQWSFMWLTKYACLSPLPAVAGQLGPHPAQPRLHPNLSNPPPCRSQALKGERGEGCCAHNLLGRSGSHMGAPQQLALAKWGGSALTSLLQPKHVGLGTTLFSSGCTPCSRTYHPSS